MSLKINVPCNETIKEIGVFNHLKVLFIPLGVSVSVSFVETPRDEDLFPLTDVIADRDSAGDMVEDARRCFLHVSGVSSEDIIVIASNVTKEGGFVDVSPINTLALETTTKASIERAVFAPSPLAEQVTIIAGGSHTVLKSTLDAIRFHASDVVGVELDLNAVKYPMYEEILYLTNIEEQVKFHNNTASSLILTVWKM